jgi:hypothetical protein
VNILVHIHTDEHANVAVDANKDVGMYIEEKGRVRRPGELNVPADICCIVTIARK